MLSLNLLGFEKPLAYLIAGLVGLSVHYGVKVFRGELNVGLWNYLFVDHRLDSFNTLLGFLISGAGLAALGSFSTMDWPVAVFGGFTAGYTVDSLLNKGVKSSGGA